MICKKALVTDRAKRDGSAAETVPEEKKADKNREVISAFFDRLDIF